MAPLVQRPDVQEPDPGIAVLHLQPGDPLPDLILTSGRRVVADYAGRYLLVLVAEPGTAVEALDASPPDGLRPGTLSCIAVFAAPTAGADVGLVAARWPGLEIAEDVAGETARRLGAVVGSNPPVPLAVLVEPGGRVARSATAASLAVAARLALAALPSALARRPPAKP